MRFVTFVREGEYRPGLLLDGQRVLDLITAFEVGKTANLVPALINPPTDLTDVIAGGDTMLTLCNQILDLQANGRLDVTPLPLAGVDLAAPIGRPRKNVFCVGSNYRAHVSEANRAQAKEDKAPEYPVFFSKPPTAVIGPNSAIQIDASVSEKIDYEVELGVVIGKAGRNITQDAAIDHIFGFTVINDVTARDIQRRHGGQYLKGKGMDTFCPMGPHVITRDEITDFANLRISLSVNGQVRQDGNTGEMIFSIPRLLESLSEGMTLEPGDILATGTPSGVGYAMDPPVFLKNGDIVTCEIEAIGTLTNRVFEISEGTVAA